MDKAKKSFDRSIVSLSQLKSPIMYELEERSSRRSLDLRSCPCDTNAYHHRSYSLKSNKLESNTRAVTKISLVSTTSDSSKNQTSNPLSALSSQCKIFSAKPLSPNMHETTSNFSDTRESASSVSTYIAQEMCNDYVYTSVPQGVSHDILSTNETTFLVYGVIAASLILALPAFIASIFLVLSLIPLAGFLILVWKILEINICDNYRLTRLISWFKQFCLEHTKFIPQRVCSALSSKPTTCVISAKFPRKNSKTMNPSTDDHADLSHQQRLKRVAALGILWLSPLITAASIPFICFLPFALGTLIPILMFYPLLVLMSFPILMLTVMVCSIPIAYNLPWKNMFQTIENMWRFYFGKDPAR